MSSWTERMYNYDVVYLVGKEFAVAKTEVREPRHATENVLEAFGWELGGCEVQFVDAWSLPFNRFHVCVFQRCNTTFTALNSGNCNRPIRSISILSYEGTVSKLQFQTPKSRLTRTWRKLVVPCPLSNVQCLCYTCILCVWSLLVFSLDSATQHSSQRSLYTTASFHLGKYGDDRHSSFVVEKKYSAELRYSFGLCARTFGFGRTL